MFKLSKNKTTFELFNEISYSLFRKKKIKIENQNIKFNCLQTLIKKITKSESDFDLFSYKFKNSKGLFFLESDIDAIIHSSHSSRFLLKNLYELFNFLLDLINKSGDEIETIRQLVGKFFSCFLKKNAKKKIVSIILLPLENQYSDLNTLNYLTTLTKFVKRKEEIDRIIKIRNVPFIGISGYLSKNSEIMEAAVLLLKTIMKGITEEFVPFFLKNLNKLIKSFNTEKKALSICGFNELKGLKVMIDLCKKNLLVATLEQRMISLQLLNEIFQLSFKIPQEFMKVFLGSIICNSCNALSSKSKMMLIRLIGLIIVRFPNNVKIFTNQIERILLKIFINSSSKLRNVSLSSFRELIKLNGRIGHLFKVMLLKIKKENDSSSNCLSFLNILSLSLTIIGHLSKNKILLKILKTLNYLFKNKDDSIKHGTSICFGQIYLHVDNVSFQNILYQILKYNFRVKTINLKRNLILIQILDSCKSRMRKKYWSAIEKNTKILKKLRVRKCSKLMYESLFSFFNGLQAGINPLTIDNIIIDKMTKFLGKKMSTFCIKIQSLIRRSPRIIDRIIYFLYDIITTKTKTATQNARKELLNALQEILRLKKDSFRLKKIFIESGRKKRINVVNIFEKIQKHV